LKVTVIEGYEAPGASTSFRVQVLTPEGQVHPEPLNDASVRPAVIVTVTVTVPLVKAVPERFETPAVYEIPVCPRCA
jgi:hypothetical protein